MAWQQINGKNFNRKDNQELAKAIKRFNSKLKRVMKKYENEDILLPDLLSVKQLKSEIGTRKDLNAKIKSINRFIERGSEDIYTTKAGVKMTKYQRKEITYSIIRSKAILRHRIKELKAEIDTSYNISNFAIYKLHDDEISSIENKIKSLKNVENRKASDLNNFLERLNNYSYTKMYQKNSIYKENYLSSLEQAFRYVDGYDRLVDKLKVIDPNDFYKIISNDEIASDIKYIYQEKERGIERRFRWSF